MNAYEYAPLARRTLKELPFRHHLIHMGMGVTGEMGELIDATKKVLIYGKAMDKTNIMEEIGDCLWYVANMLQEIGIGPQALQVHLYRGYDNGVHLRGQIEEDVFVLGEALLGMNKAVADQCATLPQLHPVMGPGTSQAMLMVEIIAGNLGILAGLLDVDLAQAMQRNIEKLAKRYGDKYSDVAALNRDTSAERTVLEGGKKE